MIINKNFLEIFKFYFYYFILFDFFLISNVSKIIMYIFV